MADAVPQRELCRLCNAVPPRCRLRECRLRDYQSEESPLRE